MKLVDPERRLAESERDRYLVERGWPRSMRACLDGPYGKVHDGRTARKPNTDKGKAAVRANYEAALPVLTELDKIQAQPHVTVACSVCA
jgi:hypothetical protein